MMCSQKEAMAERCIALKLALAGRQTIIAEMTATAESRTMRNCNCCATEQEFEEETKTSCFTKFKVPKCRKLHVFSKKRTEAHGPKEVLRKDFNIEEFQAEMTSLGFGGVNEHLKDAIFVLMNERIRIQPKKGLIIHGPPGAGKALVARRLSEILNAKVKIVRAPEIIGTLVGSSEKNLRDVFAPSIKDFEQMGEESPVHVIIFQEIDAIAGVDGFNRQTNLLVIGTTSRIELIDEGLLRGYHFRNWIKTLVVCKIKELTLDVCITENGYGTLPEPIFDAKELEVLELRGFKLELPRDQYDIVKFVSSLSELNLTDTFLGEQFFGALCASCNSLENLTLDACRGLTSLQIAGPLPKLKRVWLYFSDETKMLRIVAPNLEYLHIRSDPSSLLQVNGITDCKALKILYLHSVGVKDQDLESIFASLPNLEALYLLGCAALKKLKISSDRRLKCLLLEGCLNLSDVELDTPNLTSFSCGAWCDNGFLTLKLISASVLLKVELKLFEGSESTYDTRWYSKLVKFLGNFGQVKAIHLKCDTETVIVIPKNMRKKLVSSLYGTDGLHIEFEKLYKNHYSVGEVLDSLLWIFPQLDTLSFLRDNLKSTLKFIYDDDSFENEKTCTSLLLKRPRHRKLKDVKMENFECTDQQQLRDYLSRRKGRRCHICVGSAKKA
ncbi:hypothetical protein BC332_11657 [Capsicum chinense]|nr:hypothetical protein BC332_11657 [Capsicum chinense]